MDAPLEHYLRRKKNEQTDAVVAALNEGMGLFVPEDDEVTRGLTSVSERLTKTVHALVACSDKQSADERSRERANF